MTIRAWPEDDYINPVSVHPVIVSNVFRWLVPVVAGLVAVALCLVFLTIPVGKLLTVSSQPVVAQVKLVVTVATPMADVSAIDEFNVTGSNISAGDGISQIFTPEVRYWEPWIIAWAKKWGVDPNMIATVMQIESCGDPGAQSGAGASGLFQVMPFHFDSGENRFDPQTNALRGVNYLLKSLTAHQGDLRLTFAGYNAGISGSMRPVSAWADETVRYVRWATGIYEDATDGKSSSVRLKEWLAAGGRSLCKKAGQKLGLSE